MSEDDKETGYVFMPVLAAGDEPPTPGGHKPLHPFVQGLLDQLPEPGSNWDMAGRVTWLKGASIIFAMMYKGGGEVVISPEKEPLGKLALSSSTLVDQIPAAEWAVWDATDESPNVRGSDVLLSIPRLTPA